MSMCFNKLMFKNDNNHTEWGTHKAHKDLNGIEVRDDAIM
jgi:hypothetical protein